MESNVILENYLTGLKSAIDNLDRNEVLNFVSVLETARKAGRKIIIFGNGGSGSTASHFACDINKGVSLNKDKRYKVIALTDNMPTILAYSNDLSYDDVFIEQLKNFLEEGDIVIGISGSGNSVNVLKAIEYANKMDNTTVGITGYGGGQLKKISSMSVNANFDDMQVSEDIHMILVHLAMKLTLNYE
jgi:D-sedoheptulose 7-phosphate isomerase